MSGDPMEMLRETVGLMIMDGYEPDKIREAVDEAIKLAPEPESEDEEL